MDYYLVHKTRYRYCDFIFQCVISIFCYFNWTPCIETYFISANKFFRETEAAGTYLSYLKRIRKSRILIIDDFGLRSYSHKEANYLLDIFEDRYQKCPVIITSQVKPQGWRSLFEDEVIAEAILDRLTACAHMVEVKGESYRANHKVKNKLEIEEDRCKN